MALALGAGLALTWYQARRASLAQIDVLDAALVAVLAGVIAARTAYVAMNWNYFGDHVEEIAQLWRGGLSWHGGLIGGVIGAVVASTRRKLDVRAVFDVLTPGLMAGTALGWVGCFLAGVAYGREVFPSDPWWFLAADLPDVYNLWNPRFPTQWLGAAWAAVCFIVASVCYARRRTKDQLNASRFAATMALYSAGMFALSFVRGDAVPMLGGWRIDQVMDTGVAVAGAFYIIVTMALESKTAPKSDCSNSS